MSDYLDNLVARSLGLAEVALPRPLSLFEPLQPAGPFAPDHFSLEQAGEPSSGPEPMRPASSAPGAELSEAPPAGRREPQSDPPSRRPFQVPIQVPIQVMDRSASQSTLLLIPHQPAMPAPSAGDAGRRADRSGHAAPAGQQTVDSHPAVSEHAPLRVVLHAATPADRQSTTTQEAAPLIPAHATAPERAMTPPESIAPAPPSRNLLVAPAPRRGRAPDQELGSPLSDRAAAIPSAPEAERETAPTIKITIGRVDVRAVMPEGAPRPAPAARNPALSLEEYLKRRSGGKL